MFRVTVRLPATEALPVVFVGGGLALFPAKPQSRKVYMLVLAPEAVNELGEIVPINPVELGAPPEAVR